MPWDLFRSTNTINREVSPGHNVVNMVTCNYQFFPLKSLIILILTEFWLSTVALPLYVCVYGLGMGYIDIFCIKSRFTFVLLDVYQ